MEGRGLKGKKEWEGRWEVFEICVVDFNTRTSQVVCEPRIQPWWAHSYPGEAVLYDRAFLGGAGFGPGSPVEKWVGGAVPLLTIAPVTPAHDVTYTEGLGTNACQVPPSPAIGSPILPHS